MLVCVRIYQNKYVGILIFLNHSIEFFISHFTKKYRIIVGLNCLHKMN